MRKAVLILTTFVTLIIWSVSASAVPTMPAKIGGTVSVDGTRLTSGTDGGYKFVVKKSSGGSYSPAAEDTNGLNGEDYYIIDIPIYDATDVPGGAEPGDTAKIYVYHNGTRLEITSPSGGRFTVGDQGSVTTLNLRAATPSAEPEEDPAPDSDPDPAPSTSDPDPVPDPATFTFPWGASEPEEEVPTVRKQRMVHSGPAEAVVSYAIDSGDATSVTIDPVIRFLKPPSGQVRFLAGFIKSGLIYLASEWVDGGIRFERIYDAEEVTGFMGDKLSGAEFEWSCEAFDGLDFDLGALKRNGVAFFAGLFPAGNIDDLQLAIFRFK